MMLFRDILANLDNRCQFSTGHFSHVFYDFTRIDQHNVIADFGSHFVNGIEAGKSFFQGKDLWQTFFIGKFLLPCLFS